MERHYNQLKTRLEDLQTKLNRHINDFIDDLYVEEGKLVRQPEKISEFQNHMDKFFDKHGADYLKFLVNKLNDVLEDATEAFEEEEAELDDVAYIKDLLGVKGDKVVKRRNDQPTVLYAIASMMIISQDFINKLQSAYTGDTSIRDFRKAIRKSVSRKFHDHMEVNSVAVLFNSYNAAKNHFAKKYGYNKFRYEGGLIADSREFCIERDGHEFTREQGESWNELEWAGKMYGVDFFVQMGGYNCRHWLNWLKDE